MAASQTAIRLRTNLPQRLFRCRVMHAADHSPASQLPEASCRVHLIECKESFQREIGVEFVDFSAVGDDYAGGASCGDNFDAVFGQFVAGTSDQGVYGAGVAGDEAAADGVGGVGGYDSGRLFFEVHAGELGGPLYERVQGDVEAGEDGAAEVAALAVYGLDGRSRPDVHDDGGEPVVPTCSHGVDDPVGPDVRG